MKMLPEDTKAWLSEFDYPDYTTSIRGRQHVTRKQLGELGISPDSEIADFYLNHGALSATGWYELLEPGELGDVADYIHSAFGLPEHFIALTNHEGGGFSLLDRQSMFIYDIIFDPLDDLIGGLVAPVAESFAGYLEWRRRQRTNRG